MVGKINMNKKTKRQKKDNGKICILYGCQRPQRARGICKKHTHDLIKEGSFETNANPRKPLKKYKLKKNKKGKLCIIEGCKNLKHIRGICGGHVSSLKNRGLYKKFAQPLKPKVQYKLKKKIDEFFCRIEGCTNVSYVRGLCTGHCSSLNKNGLYEALAAPDSRTYYVENDYEIKATIKTGKCRIIENGKGCQKDVYKGGLCTKHSSIFRLYKVYNYYCSN